MTDKYFEYFQPNPKENKTTDCTIRAICAVTGLSWYEVFDKVIAEARKECIYPNDHRFMEQRLKIFGLVKKTIPRPKRGEKSMTVQKFCKEHPTGKYVLLTAHHNIGVINGKYYDTFVDTGSKVYTYYESEE